MEKTKIDALALQRLISEVAESQLSDLSDIQLAIVGGGSGDVVFA